MTKRSIPSGLLAVILATAAIMVPVVPVRAAPVAVTRFHTPESLGALGHGAVTLSAGAGIDPVNLETQVWLEAVARELAALGFGAATPNAADIVAEVRFESESTQTGAQRRGPVSVGVGGSTGGYHSGVGLGLGFSFGGGPRQIVWQRLAVTLRERATGKALWEGRAEARESAKSPQVQVAAAAPRLAHALFAGFPGTSGATISVK
ncbi:DUF4136 domain-containing protein [Novosphingobium sp.]|uniref:DUF4136 domain-containing protein n=1 Tax=Novosphingobium sp. TaxID=1874826 RepID=UPI0038BCF1EF